MLGSCGDNQINNDMTSKFEVHKSEKVIISVIKIMGSKW